MALPFDDTTLDELAKTNPDLVAQYRAKMQAPTEAVQTARDTQDYGDVVGSVGKALNEFGNASRPKDAVLYNRMDSLGKAPTVSGVAERGYDDKPLKDITARGVAQAKEDQSTAANTFNEEQKLIDMGAHRSDADLRRKDEQGARDKAARSADPKSPESAAAREYLKQVAPGATSMAGFDGLSEAQIHKIAPGLMENNKLQETIAARKEEARQRSLDRGAMFGARREDKAEVKANKQADYDASVAIPGLNVKDGFKPTVGGAAKVRDSKIAHDDLTGALDDLDNLYAQSGTNLVGDDSNRQAQIVNSMRTRLKDLEHLGALSAGDYALLDAQLPDPTGGWENVKGTFGADSYKAKSQEFRKGLERSLNSVAENNGYSMAGPAPEPGKGTGGKSNTKPSWAK
jgi:hypothetical protein